MFGKTNIFLIGPMGSGKSVVGALLARALRRRFYDSDSEIERRTGMDIRSIFEQEGEAAFRAHEREAIETLTARSKIVLATGGGAVLVERNRRHLSESGCVVYLQTSVAQQAKRVRQGATRPLLQGASDAATRLGELMAMRAPLYAEIADLTVSTDGRPAVRVTTHILRVLAAADRRAS
jgi:shikimate kinase